MVVIQITFVFIMDYCIFCRFHSNSSIRNLKNACTVFQVVDNCHEIEVALVKCEKKHCMLYCFIAQCNFISNW